MVVRSQVIALLKPPTQTPRGPPYKAMCDEAIAAYISKRGEAIWGHRGPDSGYVSGSIRYNVLKRAKHRCELCGGHEDQVALHVDHIIPRSKGGPDLSFRSSELPSHYLMLCQYR